MDFGAHDDLHPLTLYLALPRRQIRPPYPATPHSAARYLTNTFEKVPSICMQRASMVTVIVTAATAVIVSGCDRDEKLGTTPQKETLSVASISSTVCHTPLQRHPSMGQWAPSSGHSGDGMIWARRRRRAMQGETQEKSFEREKISVRETRQMQSYSMDVQQGSRMLHGRSMARSPVVPFCVRRHADMEHQTRICMCICTTYLYHLSHLHRKAFRVGVEPDDARKLKGVAIVELDTSYAGMMGCGSFGRGE